MTPEQKQLVIASWANILPVGETAAEMFYSRLFETNPELRPYFRGDMHEQGRKLMSMLNTLINGLDDLEGLLEPLRRSGMAHAAYGVTAEDYEKVCEAFLWTLERGLGDAFTPDVRQAWKVVYSTVAAVMIGGAGYED